MSNQEEARQAAEALLAAAKAELAQKKRARLERAYRRLQRWESPLIPAVAAAIATWALTEASNAAWISMTFGISAAYLYTTLGRRSAQDALRRLEQK